MRLDADFGGYLLGAPDGRRRHPRAETESARHPLRLLRRPERRRPPGLPAGSPDSLRPGRLLRVRRRRPAAARVATSSPSRRWRARRCAASCRCRRRFTSWMAPAPGRAIQPRGPDQNSMLAPMAGAAIAVGPPSGAATARLAFREVWSATADRQPGEPASGVNFEALSLTAAAHWRDRITISGGIRYNILFDELDDEQLAVAREVDAAPVGHARARFPGADFRRRFDLERVRDRAPTGTCGPATRSRCRAG